MKVHNAGTLKNSRYHIVGEVRTCDKGKLLFRIAEISGETMLLIKIKGNSCIYCCNLTWLNSMADGCRSCNRRAQITER